MEDSVVSSALDSSDPRIAVSLKAAAPSATTLRQWISSAVAKVTPQPLTAGQMSDWLSYYLTQTHRSEDDLRGEMLEIATRDAVTYGWPAYPKASAPSPSAATYVRSRDQVGQWVTEAVTSISKQWLSAADFRAWVDHFIAQTSLNDGQLKTAMREKALSDAATHDWPLLDGVSLPASSPAAAPAPASSGSTTSVRSRDLIGRWVTQAVTSVSKQWLSATDFNNWVNYFVAKTSLTDEQIKAAMKAKAVADAAAYGWPLVAGTTPAAPTPSPVSGTSPAPSKAPAPSTGTAAPAQGGATAVGLNGTTKVAPVNTVDTVVNDMRLMVDAPLKNVNPMYGFSRGPGYVIQGNVPTGEHTPDWFKGMYPDIGQDTRYWNYIVPWMVLFEGENNAGWNVRFQFRNMKAWVKKRSTGQWQLIVGSNTLEGIECAQSSDYYNCPDSAPIRNEPSGGVSTHHIRNMNFHGYFGGISYVQGNDIAAILVTSHVRMMQNDPSQANDLSKAQFLLHMGADYYRDTNGATALYPAVGIGRAKLITTQWQAFNMMTFSDIGLQEPGGGITEAEFRANHPPLD